MLAALRAENQSGLLGIEWSRIRRTGNQLLQSGLPVERQRTWIEILTRWAAIIARDARAPAGRFQLDALTVKAADPDIYDLLLFSMSTYLCRARQIVAPTARLHAVASLPESILQALAAARCNIDFRRAPEQLPDLEYDRFFREDSAFKKPEPGRKMELASLLVVVATIIAQNITPEGQLAALCDPVRVRCLQQTLVDRLRNPVAHTYADFSMKEADFILDLCADWLDAMAILAGYPNAASIPAIVSTPTVDDLSNLLYGDERVEAAV